MGQINAQVRIHKTGIPGAVAFLRMYQRVFTTVALTLSALAALWLIAMGRSGVVGESAARCLRG